LDEPVPPHPAAGVYDEGMSLVSQGRIAGRAALTHAVSAVQHDMQGETVKTRKTKMTTTSVAHG
jgi:hypothetical protein